MTEQTVQDVQAKEVPTEQAAPPSLGVGDLAAMVQIIDVVSERGSFKGPELESVGILRGRIARFLEANKAAADAAAAAEGGQPADAAAAE